MKRFIKGFGYWAVINGLFGWATYSACILGSAIGYNFMAWITCILCVFTILGFLGVTMMKTYDPEKYKELVDKHKNEWHINKYVDILYDMVILGLMVYAGFLGIATIYLTANIAQYITKKEIENEEKQSSHEIVSQYDDTLLDRMGIDQNERGR